MVTLGDYCDNGPATPALLERLSTFRQEHPGEFLPILGNHDLACLLALGYPGRDDADFWWSRWGSRYPNGEQFWTPSQYGALTREAFCEVFPTGHRRFLDWHHCEHLRRGNLNAYIRKMNARIGVYESLHRKRPANCVLTPSPSFRQAARGSIRSA